MLELERHVRRCELGLELGAFLGAARALDQALKDGAIGNAVLEPRQVKGALGEC